MHRPLSVLLGLRLLIAGIVLGACGQPDPVIVGVPEEPLLQAEDSAPAAAADPGGPEPALPPEAAPAYAKPANVYIDVRYLAGRELDACRDVVADQLGELVKTSNLPATRVREMQFERGVLAIEDGRIAMIRVPLPEPLRRTDALAQAGFPALQVRYLTFSREYRVNNEWDFRRVRLLRQDKASELVTEIEAWKWIPGEHLQRR